MDNEEVNPKFVAYTNTEPELRISEVYKYTERSPVKSNELRREGDALKARRGRLACAQEAHAKRLPASADKFRCVQQVNRENNNNNNRDLNM
jgi:hypothetical protein